MKAMKKGKAFDIKATLLTRSTLEDSSISQLNTEIENFFLANGIGAVVNLKITTDPILGRFRVDSKLAKFNYLTVTFKYASDITKYAEALKKEGYSVVIIEGVVNVQLP